MDSLPLAKIGMVLFRVDYPPDVRVEKEAISLLAAGHQIALVCSSIKGRAGRSNEGQVSVTRIPSRPSGVARTLNTLGYYANLTFPYWRRALLRWARAEGVGALHVHDLPMASTALRVGRELGIPVVVDFHENYPAALRAWEDIGGLTRLFRIRERYARAELAVARAADRVIVVVPDAAERFTRAGIAEDKFVVVSNTEPLAYGDEVMRIPRDARFGDDVVLAYAGGFAPHRGLEAVVQAIPELLATGRPYRLVLAGDGPIAGELRDLAVSLGVADRVEFPGWVDAVAVKELIASADICLVPHVRSEHTETTVPHKLFQYMVSGCAVAVSDCAPLRRIVQRARCGVVVPDGSPRAWANALRDVSAPDALRELGAAGRKACEEEYNWVADGARLVDIYDTMRRHE